MCSCVSVLSDSEGSRGYKEARNGAMLVGTTLLLGGGVGWGGVGCGVLCHLNLLCGGGQLPDKHSTTKINGFIHQRRTIYMSASQS